MRDREAVILRDVDCCIDDREIYRLLGYRVGEGTSKEEVQSAVREMKEQSREFIVARGAYLLLPVSEVSGRGPFRRAEKVGLGLCTIGDALEKRVRKLFDGGNYLEGLVLDTIGSVAVDSAADHVNYHICDVGKRAGLMGGKRSSPGYGSWSLEQQILFFDLLPHEELGMTLTSSFMMIPRKSISFAVNLMKNGGQAWKPSRCSRCGMRECSFREHDERGLR